MKWFRLHNDLLNDITVQSLPAEDFKVYINLLCWASEKNKAGHMGTQDEICWALRVTDLRFTAVTGALLTLGLLSTQTIGEATHYLIPQWTKKQYKSDTSSDRVKRYRERKRNGNETGEKRLTEQIQSTDKKKNIQKKSFHPPGLDEIREYVGERDFKFVDPEDFFNFYDSKGWMVGKNKMKNWRSAVSGWNTRNQKKDETDKRTHKTFDPLSTDF